MVLFALIAGYLLIRILQSKKIDDQKKRILYEQEKHISVARKEIVETVSHDLKNPLSTIKMSLEMIEDSTAFEEINAEVSQGLQIIGRAAHTMQSLIHNLLDHAKIEAGALELSYQDCNLNLFISQTLLELQLLASKKQIKISAECEKHLPLIRFDPDRMAQVFSNLVGNAIKFSPPQSVIQINIKKVNQSIVVVVQDQGAGISPQFLPNIFERYLQASENTKRGNGLGLSICKAIINAHGGQIQVESELGRGSSFYFSIPLNKNETLLTSNELKQKYSFIH